MNSAAPDEPFFIEVRQELRRTESFVDNWGALRSRLAALGIRLDEHWMVPERLYLRVVLPSGTIGERSALITKLQEEPLVAKVIAGSASNFELKNVGSFEKVSGKASLAENKLRGYREKRKDFKPDLSAPHTGEIIVKYLEENAATPAKLAAAKTRLEAVHSKFAVRAKHALKLSYAEMEVIELPSVVDFNKALQAYLDSPEVEYAQPNYLYRIATNDTYYSNLWGMPKIQAPSAWNIRTDASSVTVAVLDTGIDYNHTDLSGNMWVNPGDGSHGWNVIANNNNPMDDYAFYTYEENPEDPENPILVYHEIYHGTHVSGTIGAVGNNSYGVVGVAWSTKLMAVKVLNQYGSGSSSSVTTGIDYARNNGAQIINASLGGGPSDPTTAAAIGNFCSAGGLFVCAAGNNYSDNDSTPNYPSCYGYPNQVVVGATDQSDNQSVFSNYGRWSVDVFAPGVDIYSAQQSNRFQSMSGTSMASPHVAGMMALAKAQYPWESVTELADRARFSTDAVGGLDSLCMSGGRINAASALGSRPTIGGLSTRCLVLTGDAIAITGINITGPNAKRVVFRAQGPNLANFGVQGVLANPTIAIYNGAGQWIGSNDDWQSLSSSEQTELAAAGLTPVYPLESAWVATLNPGIYTVHLSGVGGGTGVGMIEGYTLDGSTVNRLYGISTRCYVNTGDQVAIAGAFVGGNKPRQVLIRATGPSLSAQGVSNPISDTVITLYDSNGQVVASNDDWRAWDGTSTALENRIQQSGFAPSDDRESIMVVKLNDDGAHTVILSGKNGATGVGQIEVYEF